MRSIFPAALYATVISVASPVFLYNQKNNKEFSFQIAASAASDKEQSLIRPSGSYDFENGTISGFVDFYRNASKYYGKFFARYNLREKFGLHAELNGGSGSHALARAGLEADILSKKSAFAKVKFTLSQYAEPQAGTYFEVKLPKNGYFENWSTVNKGWKVQTEVTLGKKIMSKISAEAHAARNVNVKDWVFRGGLRYALR